MLDAIYLHDQPETRREEIRDGVPNHDLPPKRDTELSSGKLLPKPALRLRRRPPVLERVTRERVLASGSG
jgi:hypothetical protein